jgi:flagellar biosynthesis/type III secretory pathway protein FliH
MTEDDGDYQRGVEVCRQLGIDVETWAAEVRQRVAEAVGRAAARQPDLRAEDAARQLCAWALKVACENEQLCVGSASLMEKLGQADIELEGLRARVAELERERDAAYERGLADGHVNGRRLGQRAPRKPPND